MRHPAKLYATILMILASLAIGCLSASPAGAAGPAKACGLISAPAIAKALGLGHTRESSSASQPGNGSGSLSSVCRLSAWSGRAPRTQKQTTSKLLNGNAATLIIQAHEEEPGPSAEQWRDHGYDQALLSAIGGIASEVLVVLRGARFAAPPLGAPQSGGYQAGTGRRREVVGIWWDRAQYKFITIEIVGANSKPILAQLRRIAATAVPAFGL